ncbi:RHS repeat-associated core domain-containing protein [Actinoplanes sp. NPDC051346]|uniref:RHS repeat-associated core domain-containing protein n=1 Tax=Actinoplanes sp. NPDC051346 TaxID=3155048 RepID=UPI003447D20C
MRLGRADGGADAGQTKVTVDYKAFATAYGADWASRLRLVSLPSCALSTPAKKECAPTPLPSRNDQKAKTVSAEVTVSSAARLVAATAAASGPTGDYAASSLNPSATWAAGGNTGEFSWSYAMRTPPAIGGPAPQLALSYSSQSVDGQHAASNNQPSWTGDGFGGRFSGFIERRYQTCAKDMDGSANNDTKTGDLCWETDNATLSLPGHTGELLYNSTDKRWHLRSEDGSRIERKVNATNGDNNGEYWVVTTADGNQYWFGLNRLPGWTAGKPVTNSTSTVPVFGNDPNEPCHATAFADSDCAQAWRWNLDYVVDRNGNSMSYWYQKETNKYGRNLKADDAAQYDRSSWLERIDYGTRQVNGTDSVHQTSAPLRVDFKAADRCTKDCGTHDAVHWPDVPWDAACTGDSCTANFAPSFWSTKRLASVTTQIRNGTGYRDVERWTLTHTFPDPGDGNDGGLWLSKLSHTGLVGGSAAVPDIDFTPVQMANRVDKIGDHSAAMNRMRITQIRTESGGSISVVYSDQDCKAGEPKPDPATNTRRCYPVRWEPEGYSSPVTDWFNKYVVTTVYENDNTGGAPPSGSPRVVYSYDYYDGAAWHYTDDDGLVKKKYKTWSDFRGYGRVGVTVGDPGEQTYAESRYFRGMNGDRLNSDGGTKSVRIDGIADEDWFAGMTREAKTLNGPGGAVVTRTLNTPWASGPTASRTFNNDTVTARYTATGTVTNHTALDGGRGERVTKTVTSFDEYGMPVTVDDLGADGVAGDEQCTKLDYTPRNTNAWILDRVHRTQSYAVSCAATGGTLTESDVIGETRTSFDNQAFEATPAKGQSTQMQTMSAWNNGAPTFTVIAKQSYDVHGRSTATWDALNHKSTTAYTPAVDAPATSILTTNPLTHATTATVEPAWGAPTAAVDPNGKRTDVKYDPLGRVIAVWKPGRAKNTDTANMTYDYDIRTNAPSVVTTSVLNAAGAYNRAYTLYDGMLRPRQSQAPSPSGGRIVTENFYDTVGRATLSFGAYHTTGTPGGTLLAATDRAFVPKQNRSIYDGAGRVKAQIFQPYGFERWRTTTSYSGDRTDVTPPAGGTATSTVTDARGRTVQLRQYHGATPTPSTAGSWDTTTYTYDRRGYQTKIADTLGNDWTYIYDSRGRMTKADDPDKGATTFTYDNAGNILTTTDARGKKIAYLYDPLGRKRAAYDNQVGGTLRAQWIYDTVAKGQLSQSTRFVGSAPYQSKILDYNDTYQPGNTQIIIPASETGLAGIYNYNTTYNIDGSVQSTSIPGTNTDLHPETLTYAYSDLGLPTTVKSLYGTQNLSYVADTDYNALGELDQIELYTGSRGRVFTAYKRELETGRLTGIRTDRDSVAPYVLADSTYQYNNAGDITKIADAAPDPADDNQCFTSDYLDRLTEAWTPADGNCTAAPSATKLGGPAPYWHSWRFDKVGNRTRETVHDTSGDKTTDYQYPAQGSSAVRPHALTGVTGARTGSYTYDEAGNTLTRPSSPAGTQTMTWDPEGHLDSTTDTTGTTSYIYDADGNRLVRRDPGGRTLYLGNQEIRSTPGAATAAATRYYGFAGSTVASRTIAGLTWLSNDHQGTAALAIDAHTQKVAARRQTPYGNRRGEAVEWPNTQGFVGGTNDNTGLTHLGAREYDPTIGRFISVDPLQNLADPQQWNGYAYSHNNPVTFSDPSGLADCDFAGNCGVGGGNLGTPGVARGESGGGKFGGGRKHTDAPQQSGGCGRKWACDPAPENGTTSSGTIADLPDFKTFAVSYTNTCGDWMVNSFGFTCSYGDLHEKQKTDAFGEYLCKYMGACDLKEALLKAARVESAELLSWIPWAGVPFSLYLAKEKWNSGDRAGAAMDLIGMVPLAKAAKGAGRACSFGADVPVLMADGTTKPFDEVKVGDEVLATDPETGEQGPRKIEKVWVHDDDLYVLSVAGSQLVTTEDHPFWNQTDRGWQQADELDSGDLVRTPTGTARVTGFDYFQHHKADAYTLTVNDLHTYYVLAGTTPVLVHNCGEAVVHLDPVERHATISIRNGDEVLHTEQLGTTGTDAIPALRTAPHSPTTINVRIPLRNPGGAMAYQEVTLGRNLGPYNEVSQSCVTYCGNVLKAGGVEGVPNTTLGITKWLLQKHG